MMKRFLAALLCIMMLSLNCAAIAEGASFAAGTYSATVEGRNGPLTVEVTFTNDAIESVAVTEHTETAGISDSAIANIPARIVDAQSLGIDSVSGATITSDAIVKAVADCVVQAGGDPDALQTTAAIAYEKNLTPGTYTATAHGHHSDVTVEVVLTENAIESVSILDEGETYNLSEAALSTLPDAIVANQSTGIDAVTGATYTSRAILSAVENCLEQAGGAQAVLAFSTKVEADPWSTEEIAETYDVVVVGSGMSGLAAALAAQDGGAKVAVLEKLPYWGGTSQTSYGFFSYTSDEGQNTQEQTDYLMRRFNGIRQGDTYMDGAYPKLESVKAIAENSYDNLKWLEEKGAAFTYYLSSDMGSDLRYGIKKDDGTVEIGHAVQGFAQFAEPDREPNVASMGMEKLFKTFTDNGGVLYLNTTAESLITDETGKVVGVKATGKDGVYTFTAGSVVLCTGGFGASEEMIAELAPAYIGEENVTLPGNTGDGIRMAREVGAAIEDDQFMMGGSGHAVVTDEDMISGWKDNETPKSSIQVNPNGLRVNSENPESYSNSTLHTNPDSRDYYWIIINEKEAAANTVLADIYDPESATGSYKDLLEEQLAAGNERFFKADTLSELAKQIRIVPSTLAYTVNRYNELCKQGVDTDLFKDAQFLVPMSEGPWYAVKAYMVYFGTVGGVKTDENAAVLKADGTPIPGLYAAGETSNHNIFNLSYVGGWSMAECLAFGRIAGTNAAVEALTE